MTRRIISLLREIKCHPDRQQTYENFPFGSVVGRRRSKIASDAERPERLLSVTSQIAWQRDLDVGHSLPPVMLRNSRRQSREVADDNRVSADSECEGHVQGQAGRDSRTTSDDWPATVNSLPALTSSGNRQLPVRSDVTHDVERNGSRRHRQARRKCIPHHHHHQQQQQLETPVETPKQFDDR